MRKINPRDFSRATRSTPREVNRQIVLNLVREHQPISRAELARQMRVARGVVTPIVQHLLDAQLIYEGATGSISRGRRPRLLHIRTQDRLALSVDVRLRSTSLMLSDFGGQVLAREALPTPGAPEALVAELAARAGRLCRAHEAAGRCEGLGVVVPGVVEHGSGRLLHAPTLGWTDVPLREMLRAATGLEVHVERDAVACALAQMWLGRGTGAHSFVYLTVSDGVGAGVVLEGQLVRGHRDAAGEFGHVPLCLDGPPCLCGARGCLEAYTCDAATLGRYLGREIRTREAHAALRESGPTLAQVVERARAGDAAARAALEATAHYLGVGLAAVVNALDPALVIVGGEVAGAWEIVLPVLRAAMRARALAPGAAETALLPEPADGETRLRGAAALVMAPVFAAPQVA